MIMITCSLLLLSALLCPRQTNSFSLFQPHEIKANGRSRVLISLHKDNDDIAVATEEEEKEQSVVVSENLLRSMRRRTPASSRSSQVPLNLETDFYDPTTGLHSEGVWHNCLAGMASVKLAELQEKDHGQEHLMAALRIADSLWEHSWDGVSFQRRSWSGMWDHSRLREGALNPPEQANYYQESTEHRCIQHGAALLFWSKLMRHHYVRSEGNEICYRCRAQHKLIAKQFLHEYWDESIRKWRTVSRSQGGGTVSRKSASSGYPAAGAGTDIKAPYYRAVDQAIGLMCCLEMMEDGNESVGIIIRSTCQALLFDFNYQDETSVTYLSLDRNRNLWHDGWVALALVSCAQKCPNCWPVNSDQQLQVALLLDRLREIYFDEESGTMWHWTKTTKRGHEEGNVHYCGDNALWYAICKEWQQGSNDTHSFWGFVHELQSNSEDGLVSVADMYSQVRLHPNTELAFLALLPIDCNDKQNLHQSNQCQSEGNDPLIARKTNS